MKKSKFVEFYHRPSLLFTLLLNMNQVSIISTG